MGSGRNPFKPTAGASPPLLVGRQGDLDEYQESLDDGPGAPGRLTIFTGARGVGKTVMLTEVRDLALKRGWVAVHNTATSGMIDRLTHKVTSSLYDLDPQFKPGRPVTGVSLPGGFGLTLGERPAQVIQWEEQVMRLLDVLERHRTGLLITVDEVHNSAREDLRDLATTYQHLVSDGRDVALAFAGLPSAVSDLLNDDVLTFLRRANRVDLKDVGLSDVERALRRTIEENGREITLEASAEAARATGGYPFMIQLVGYHIWRAANGPLIDQDAVSAGVPVARRRLGSTVHATALADLSDVDRTVLVAMAGDDGPSSVAELARRLETTTKYVGVYRKRLIEAGVIEPVRRGYVDFSLPYLREYLREHVAQDELNDRVEGNGQGEYSSR